MASSPDFSAFFTPVDAAQLRDFRASVRSRPEFAERSNAGGRVFLAIGLVVTAVVLLGTVASVVVRFVALSAVGRFDGGAFLTIALVAVITIITVVALLRRSRGPGRWERWLRLTRFAEANGFSFAPYATDPALPGAIFDIGSGRTSLDTVRAASGRFFEYGNYRCVTRNGNRRTTHDWGYLALRLDRSLPHLVLDSHGNNGLFGISSLPGAYAQRQVLGLEGDFTNHFTLYAPAEYERDALYVLTPDVMAALVDHASTLDVEIVDDWLFAYSPTPFDMVDPHTHERMLRLVDVVGAETLHQSKRYVDDRIGDFSANTVAAPGKRLARGVPVAAVVVGAMVLAFGALRVVTELFAAR